MAEHQSDEVQDNVISSNGHEKAEATITSTKKPSAKNRPTQSAAIPTKKRSRTRTSKPSEKARATSRIEKRGPGGGSRRLFPQNSLEEALRGPRASKEKNGGERWPRAGIAKAC